ncbi:MAG: YcaO-like family protein [Pseudonocardiaceae bacterium]
MALPFRSRLQVSRSFPEWTIAQSGIFLSIADRRFPVIGSACSRDSRVARTTSFYEAIERLLTRVAAHSEDRWLDARQGVEGQMSPVSVRLSQVLPRPDPQGILVTDGTGLAVHNDHDSARSHAVAELQERALLAQLWYRGGLPMRRVSLPQDGDHMNARTWVLDGGDMWFAVADAINYKQLAYALGAAVRDSRDSAAAHALSEAVMVLDSAQRGAIPPHVQKLARQRASALAGPLAMQRREHLDGMIERACSTNVEGFANLWLHARIRPQDVTVAHVLTGPDWTMVRATAENALLLRDARHQHEFSHIVSDPLC